MPQRRQILKGLGATVGAGLVGVGAESVTADSTDVQKIRLFPTQPFNDNWSGDPAAKMDVIRQYIANLWSNEIQDGSQFTADMAVDGSLVVPGSELPPYYSSGEDCDTYSEPVVIQRKEAAYDWLKNDASQSPDDADAWLVVDYNDCNDRYPGNAWIEGVDPDKEDKHNLAIINTWYEDNIDNFSNSFIDTVQNSPATLSEITGAHELLHLYGPIHESANVGIYNGATAVWDPDQGTCPSHLDCTCAKDAGLWNTGDCPCDSGRTPSWIKSQVSTCTRDRVRCEIDSGYSADCPA